MRGFRASDSQAWTLGSNPVTAYPFSIGTIFVQTAAGASGTNFCIASLNDSGVSTDGHRLMYYGTGSGSGFSARTSVGATDREAKVGLTITTGLFYWVLGVWESASDRRIYVVRVGTIDTAQQTTSLTPTITDTAIGRFYAGATASQYLSGQLGYVSFWDNGFSTQEVTDYFGHGMASQRNWWSPQIVKPANLKFMWQGRRLASTSSNDVDQVGGISMTNVGSPTNLDEPPMLVRIAA